MEQCRQVADAIFEGLDALRGWLAGRSPLALPLPGRTGARPSHRHKNSYVACLGLRPRLATTRPPIFSASASVTSSSREPRRASANVTRTVAPLPSGISSPDMSETRIVFLAKANSFRKGLRDSSRQAPRFPTGRDGQVPRMIRNRRVGLVPVVWIVVGVVVAAIYDYFDSLPTVGEILTVIAAVLLWPLLLFGFDINIQRS
jgi:hypothetical protein